MALPCQLCESRVSRRCDAFFLGGENDFDAAMPAAFAFVAALMGWPSCFAVDSPAVFAALAALSGFLRRLSFGAARAVAAIFLDGCRGVAQSGLPSPPGVAFSRFQGLLAALEMLVGAVAVSSSSSSQYEWVELGSDHEPEPPGTVVDTQGTDVFDIPVEARLPALDEHEPIHFVFEHGVSEELRMSGQVRARDRLDENVFDLPAVVHRRGWDEHELTHKVFEFGEEEGMRMMEELTLEDDVSSVFQGGVVQEPGVWPWTSCYLSMRSGRLAKPQSQRKTFIYCRGQRGLGVWKMAAEQSLAEWYSGWKLVGVGWVLCHGWRENP